MPGLRLLDAERVYAMEPGLAPGLRRALFSPTAGTVNPWQLGIAACENAVRNGVQLRLNTKVEALRRETDSYLLETNRGALRTRAVINCAGLAAHRVQELLFPPSVRIVPTAGDYLVLDKDSVGMPAHILQYEPEEKTKGLTVVPTVEGSLLLGPSERDNTLDYAAAEGGLLWVREQAARRHGHGALPGRALHVRRYGASGKGAGHSRHGCPEGRRRLGEPDWLFYAGNCHHIHDIADAAAAEGERIGKEEVSV